ncbi:MAG TPA: hypothetical protein VF062_01380 [Candidatus Limnocylindrales bacterium]
MRKLIIVLACVLAVGATAACSKEKPTDNPSNASDASSEQTPEEKIRAFAQCMRDHGVPMEDPVITQDGDGGDKVEMRIGPSGGPKAWGESGPGPGDEKFKEAEAACRHLQPQGGDLGRGPSPEQEEQMRAFAKCMRENGVEGFPDPQPGGGIAIGPESGVNPEDPAFKEAHEKCEELMPRPKGDTKVAS